MAIDLRESGKMQSVRLVMTFVAEKYDILNFRSDGLLII